jgi:hypothetical protein
MKLLNNYNQETNVDVINSMLNDSTWSDLAKGKVYKFENGRDLCINGNNHLTYLLNGAKGKVKIKIGTLGFYFVEYVNDFTLYLYNDKEKFRLMPECI